MFSVQLDPAGVTALEASMKGETSPLAVVYGLEMYALRPAYAVTLSIDWDRVQERLDEEYGVDALFFSAQIANTVDKLIEDRVITLTADTFVPEGEDERAVLSRRDRAVQEVQDMITQAFFEPSLNPAVEAEDGWDKAEHLVDTISRLAVTHGAAAFGGFTYKKTHYTRIDTKTLNVSMSERTTVKRQIFPQGHLSGLFRALTASGVALDRFVQDIDLDHDPFFEQRRITVVPRVDFDREAVTSVSVRLRLRGRGTAHAGARQGLGAAADRVVGQGRGREGRPRCRHRHHGEPRRRPRLRPPGVDLRADADGPGRGLRGHLAPALRDRAGDDHRPRRPLGPLRAGARSPPLRRPGPRHRRRRHGHPRRAARGDDLEPLRGPGRTAGLHGHRHLPGGRLPRRHASAGDRRRHHPDRADPVPEQPPAPLEVVPVVDWTQTKTVFVDLSYTDEEHDVLEEQSLRFTEDDDAPKTFGVDLADPQRRLVTYQVSVIGRDGSLSRSPHSATLDRRLLVRPGCSATASCTVSPDTADFDRRRVSQVVVDLVYEDEPNGVRFADSVTPAAGGDRGIFEFDYVDESASQLAVPAADQLDQRPVDRGRLGGRRCPARPRRPRRRLSRSSHPARTEPSPEDAMLLLDSARTVTVAGITAWPDHKSKNDWWYLPFPVELAHRGPDNDAQFTLVLYKQARPTADGTGGHGFLMFETDLLVPEATLAKLADAVRPMSDGEPRLSVVPFKAGTVSCMALDLRRAGRHRAAGRPAGHLPRDGEDPGRAGAVARRRRERRVHSGPEPGRRRHHGEGLRRRGRGGRDHLQLHLRRPAAGPQRHPHRRSGAGLQPLQREHRGQVRLAPGQHRGRP